MGYVTKAEWQAGMKALNVDSAEKLVKAVARLEDDMKDMAVFRDFYIWLFTFAKDSEQRNLEIDAAKALWLLALPSSRYPTVSKFLAFLDEARPLKVINKDQWRSLLDFLVMVPGDFSNYDDSNACRCPIGARARTWSLAQGSGQAQRRPRGARLLTVRSYCRNQGQRCLISLWHGPANRRHEMYR
ncbi:Cullin binding-domain-containing protein [Polychytrium aggregatum]|uniref:Cullin binding-domain-containing protein n=1 Tax=Polychytrium aggregatum TaxID=110093 RepID=UPI0022FEC3E9|nr:Cullin binding-domain-containing protein [Polychytrium aggregatum]KAI9202805.1 Cullin binding-domain-containing protein [Polychytrium aggregatum]